MTRFFVVFLIFGFFSAIEIVNSANILAIMGFPSPSHHLWNTKIIEALVARGHNLTVLSSFLPESPTRNAHYLHLDEVIKTMRNALDYEFKDFGQKNAFEEILVLYKYMLLACEGSIKSTGFEILRNYPDDFKFDLVIHDLTSGACMLAFLHKFGYPPLVGVSPYKFTPEVVDMIGGHNYPGYIPLLSLPYTVNMTFMQRLENCALTVVNHIYKDYIYIPKRDKLLSPYFDKNLPPLREIEQKMAVALINIHPVTDFPNPFPPNVIQVAGLQISDAKPLPDDLENFIKKARNGAILISFGTNVDSQMFSEEKQNMIIEAVKKFPTYNFLWKFDKDVSAENASNLLVKKWLPQNDILAHPKIKAFVSHCGGLSTAEATWHGVPIIAVPFYLDQKTNANNAILAGVAKFVDVKTMTPKIIEDAIRIILEDSSYIDRMKLRSSRFRDRPMKPLTTAIWWIEYILRDPNPTHLRSPAISLGIWRSNSYDIIFYTIVFVSIVMWGAYKVLKIFFKFLFSTDAKRKIKIK